MFILKHHIHLILIDNNIIKSWLTFTNFLKDTQFIDKTRIPSCISCNEIVCKEGQIHAKYLFGEKVKMDERWLF